jgi:hypothetical protein
VATAYPTTTLADAGSANEQPAAPAIEYSAPALCPDGEAFRSRFQARLAGSGTASPRSLHVEIEQGAGEYLGRLTVRDRDDAEATREVRGERCEEVVDALAFLSALSVDLLQAQAPNEQAPAATAAPAQRPTPTPEATPRETARPPGGSRLRWTAGAQAEGVSFVGPGVQLGAGLFAEADLSGAGVLSPAVRITASWIQSRSISVQSGGTATLSLAAGRVDACPVRLPGRGNLWVAPCAGLEVGVVRGEGEDVANAHSGTRLWVAADALTRLTWDVVGPLAAELQAGVTVPFVLHEFRFEPNVGIYQPPAVGAFGGIGAGVHFP